MLDISKLDPAYVTVKNVNAGAAAANVVAQSDTAADRAVADAAEDLPVA